MQSFANPGKRGDRYTLLGLDDHGPASLYTLRSPTPRARVHLEHKSAMHCIIEPADSLVATSAVSNYFQRAIHDQLSREQVLLANLLLAPVADH